MSEERAAADEGTGHYDSQYGHFAEDLHAAIRREAFGEEIGQNSWLTADEHRTFFGWLGLDGSSAVLDVASGSGGPALYMARTTGCRVTGIDLHQAGVDAANAAAGAAGQTDRVRFLRADARERLPFDEATFDAAMCIDSINHLYERRNLLDEWYRVVRPGGRILFTNPITVTGLLRRDEMVARSAGMGEFVFTPPGADEAMIMAAGFADVVVEDRTANMERVATDLAAARARHRQALDEIEGAEINAAYARFLEVVATLARERRLSRPAYIASRP